MEPSQDVSLALDPPPGWSPRSAYSVRLTVREDSEGNLEFSWSQPLFDSGSPLDLGVSQDCLILLECEEAQGLSWSRAVDAITLKNGSNTRLYFALKYIDRGTAYDRSDYPEGRKCTQICFGAQLNVERPDDDRHPFNLDVELQRGSQALPIHIDPDIQNPKV